MRKVKEGLFSNKWHDSVNNYFKIFHQELYFHGGILLRRLKISYTLREDRMTQLLDYIVM